MGTHISGGTGSKEIKTFAVLDQIITVLGSTKTTFFPFLESHGGSNLSHGIRSYKENQHNLFSRDEAGVIDLNAEFSPYKHVSGVHSYDFFSTGSQYLVGTDDSNVGFPSNADFSVGAWILPRDVSSTTIMGKYDVATLREWRFSIDNSSKIELEVFDETNNEDRTGASDTAIAADEWSFIVATTDNNDSDASMTFYLNGAADGTGNTESGAAYASSPDTAGLFAIGATLNTEPAVTALFSGRIALPFVCGKILTAANVTTLHGLGRTLLGL